MGIPVLCAWCPSAQWMLNGQSFLQVLEEPEPGLLLPLESLHRRVTVVPALARVYVRVGNIQDKPIEKPLLSLMLLLRIVVDTFRSSSCSVRFTALHSIAESIPIDLLVYRVWFVKTKQT